MALLNLYYRAFSEYRKYTLKDKACAKRRSQIVESLSEDDVLQTIRTTCHIDLNWVEQIEQGLPYFERAIAEERQFIKNEGEVLDIEKIKRVSKDSVEHLARHSDLITHVPEDGGDIIPDKIYMVERLSDYAVYENRFLYMALCYMRDFIDLRLKKIKELGNTYKANATFNREVRTQHGKISYKSSFVEYSNKDPFSFFDEEAEKIIARIESCQHIVSSLLAKPLMVIVAKSPMIKPPITKTNVLKMNIKFKNAVAVYEYLSAYQGPGYKIEEIKKTIKDFEGALGDELSELICITAFLTYSYGNELTQRLKREYDLEEKQREYDEREKLFAKIEKLKKKFNDGSLAPEEYIAMLEEGYNSLKKENEKLFNVEKELDILTIKYEDLKKEKIALNAKLIDAEHTIENKDFEFNELNKRREAELDLAEQRRRQDLRMQQERLDKEKEEIISDCNLKIEEQKAECEKSILLANETCDKAILDTKTDCQTQISIIKEQFEILKGQKDLMSARLKGIQGEEMLNLDEEMDEKKFMQLEREFIAFYDVFMAKWKETKKQIRNKMLWSKIRKTKEKI